MIESNSVHVEVGASRDSGPNSAEEGQLPLPLEKEGESTKISKNTIEKVRIKLKR